MQVTVGLCHQCFHILWQSHLGVLGLWLACAEAPNVTNAQLGPYLLQEVPNAVTVKDISFKLFLMNSTRHVNQAQEVGA